MIKTKWFDVAELAVDGKVDLTKIVDPYLLFGGSYGNDPKDSKDFKYLLFTECPKFTPAHKSFMAKFLTPEVGETRYIVTCRLVLCCVKSCRVILCRFLLSVVPMTICENIHASVSEI